MSDPSVLIVEDEPITRFMMGEFCDHLGLGCETAETGMRALDMLRDDPGRADTVLMDVHLPDLSGPETCAQLREFQHQGGRPLTIIAMSADEFWHDPVHGKAAGFDTVLPKPVSIDGLERALRHIRACSPKM